MNETRKLYNRFGGISRGSVFKVIKKQTAQELLNKIFNVTFKEHF